MESNTLVRDQVYAAIIAEYKEGTGKDPNKLPGQKPVDAREYIKNKMSDAYSDAAASLAQAALLTPEQAASSEKARWSEMAAQTSKSAAFMRSLANRMSDAVAQSGGASTAQEAMIISNLRRADSLLAEANGYIGKALDSGVSAKDGLNNSL
ncbi:hypothetical protein [Xanthomonas theicola]|uniref:hypothetical protein n=1 Tax=Xanthomonas theicola TaxID=56464 RepID=UPI000FF8B072|nr:hypothetical protein [Xanthomonas theicola]QNH26560.1 hypothetical protein G4Q83_20080 [Xanthomonas theicola]